MPDTITVGVGWLMAAVAVAANLALIVAAVANDRGFRAGLDIGIDTYKDIAKRRLEGWGRVSAKLDRIRSILDEGDEEDCEDEDEDEGD